MDKCQADILARYDHLISFYYQDLTIRHYEERERLAAIVIALIGQDAEHDRWLNKWDDRISNRSSQSKG
jgi:hypothetical protein